MPRTGTYKVNYFPIVKWGNKSKGEEIKDIPVPKSTIVESTVLAPCLT